MGPPGTSRGAASTRRRSDCAELALDAIRRLEQLERDAKTYEAELTRLLDLRRAVHLRKLRGVGPVVAAIGHGTPHRGRRGQAPNRVRASLRLDRKIPSHPPPADTTTQQPRAPIKPRRTPTRPSGGRSRG